MRAKYNSMVTGLVELSYFPTTSISCLVSGSPCSCLEPQPGRHSRAGSRRGSTGGGGSSILDTKLLALGTSATCECGGRLLLNLLIKSRSLRRRPTRVLKDSLEFQGLLENEICFLVVEFGVPSHSMHLVQQSPYVGFAAVSLSCAGVVRVDA